LARLPHSDSSNLLDAVLAPRGICPELCEAMDAGGPYGAGWPAPRVAAGPVRIVKAGDQIGQGVGYLDDGTMVVVEQGRSAIGQEVMITVTSVLQTPAGRMIFGRIGGTGDHPVLK